MLSTQLFAPVKQRTFTPSTRRPAHERPGTALCHRQLLLKPLPNAGYSTVQAPCCPAPTPVSYLSSCLASLSLGDSVAQTPERLGDLSFGLCLLSLSYGATGRVLEAFGVHAGNSAIYQVIRAVGEHLPDHPEEGYVPAVAQASHGRGSYGWVLCTGRWFSLGLAAELHMATAPQTAKAVVCYAVCREETASCRCGLMCSPAPWRDHVRTDAKPGLSNAFWEVAFARGDLWVKWLSGHS